MGSSADAAIVYGVHVPEDALPWGDGDPTEWWFNSVCGFKPEFQFRSGMTPEYCKQWIAERNAFREAHPMPFDVVRGGCLNYGESDTVICLPRPFQVRADWCAPKSFEGLPAPPIEVLAAFNEFLAQHLGGAKPGWLIVVSYG